MELNCPHCETALNVEPQLAGQVVQCPGCNNRFQVPKADVPGSGIPGLTARATAQTQRGGWPEADPTNVPLLLSLGYGLAAMAVTVGLLYLIKNSFVGQVFFTGGWVNYAEFVLFFWGLGILFLKIKKTQHQRAALLLDVLPRNFGRDINPRNVSEFIDHLYRLPAHLRDSMMVNHIRKGLELFEARPNNSEVAAMLSAQSSIDANRIAGSYSLLKVFLWAIPILGFIGTVLGLSFAMAGFGATDLTDMGALKNSVSAITAGLATAFNTTLLGLILSIMLIFPMSAIQKHEEDCLNEIDAFCNERLLPRLNDGGASGTSAGDATNPAMLAQLFSDLTDGQRQLVEDLRGVAALVQQSAGELEGRAQEHQQRVEEQFGVTLSTLTTQTSEAVGSTSQAATKHIETLATGIAGLNRALVSLGEKQIVIQEAPRKRWRLFGGGGGSNDGGQTARS
ncbi:MAG: MotA/TolQ/ExbB proton channel family protein [Verrucomicrobiota bacterium]|nr:MotA/TolQ/ExbB proton channel family protein [Verrucomicrobiota bacterium]